MKTVNASLTIGRRQSNVEKDFMVISIHDEDSRQTITEVKVDLRSMMEALTGLADVKVSATVQNDPVLAQRFGHTCINERVHIPSMRGMYDKEEQKKLVEAHFESNFDTSVYELWNDGTSSRQDSSGHTYIVRRWVTDDEENGE